VQCKYWVIILFDNSCLLPLLLLWCRVGGWLSGLCRWDKQIIMKWWPTNERTPWNIVLLEKLLGPQLLKKLSAFYGTWRFMNEFERARHLSIFWAKSIQFMAHTWRRLWTFCKMVVFLWWGVVSTSPHPQAGVSPLVGCPRLLIQYIQCCLPYWSPFLHLQPQDAACCGEREPLIMVAANSCQNNDHIFHLNVK